MCKGLTIGLLITLSAGISWAEKTIHIPFENLPEEVRYVEDAFVVNLKPSFGQIRKSPEFSSATGKFGIEGLDQLGERFGFSSIKALFPGAELRIRREGAPDLNRYYVVEFNPQIASLQSVLSEVSENPNIEHVEPIGIHPMNLTPNDPYFENPPPTFPYPQWHLQQLSNDVDIDAPEAWDSETGDPTVIVGILDSGLKYNHGDLGGSDPPGPGDDVTNGNVWVNTDEIPGNEVDDDGNGKVDDVIGWDFVHTRGPDRCAKSLGEDCKNQDNDPSDFNGHGTHVGGIVSAITNNAYSVAGVSGGWGGSPADGAKLMPLRIGYHAVDNRGYVRMDFAAQAISYAVGKKQDGHNIVALNCSWGSSNSGGLGAAIDDALANDIMIIHAAGNSNSSTPDFLGGKTGVMNVAATDDSDVKASFSNYGTWIDVASPGVDITSTYHYYPIPENDYVASMSGTSMAAPIVAGIAALLESKDATLTRQEKFDLIVNNTDNIDAENPGYVGFLGSGRVNAKKALDAATPCVDAASPSVTVTVPNGGEDWTINSTQTITWNASDDCQIWGTEIRLDRGNDGTYEEGIVFLSGNPGSYDWTVTGPATTLAKIQVTVTDGDTNSTSDASDGTFTIIDPGPSTEMFVFDIQVTKENLGRGNKRGVAVVTIHDNNNQPVSNATVTGDFTGKTNDPGVSAVTNVNGNATLFSSTAKGGGEWCFEVTDVIHATLSYNSSLNNITKACESGPLFSDGDENLTGKLSYPTVTIHPEPMNGMATISYSIPFQSEINIEIYDIVGKKVRTLVSEVLSKGTHNITFDGRNEGGSLLASGIYFFHMKTGSYSITEKLVLIR
jgi:subtilisin family serine protease